MRDTQYENYNMESDIASEYYGQEYYIDNDVYNDQNLYINNEYSYDSQYTDVYSEKLNNDYSYDEYPVYEYYNYNQGVSLDYCDQQFLVQDFDIDDEPFITVKDILYLGICLVFAFLLAYLIVTYVAQHTMVSGTSMSYNLVNNDILVIDRLTYNLSEPKRFDIVVFPVKDNVFYIKRIIGMPGEKVRIDEESGSIYINDKLLLEDYGFEPIYRFGDVNEVTLGDEEYFVMGDNRNDSKDSRSYSVGNIPRKMITGRAVFRLWPFDRFGQIDSTINAKIKSGQLQSGDIVY